MCVEGRVLLPSYGRIWYIRPVSPTARPFYQQVPLYRVPLLTAMVKEAYPGPCGSLNASLGNVGRLVEITGFGLLLAVLSNLCATPAVATAGPATILW